MNTKASDNTYTCVNEDVCFHLSGTWTCSFTQVCVSILSSRDITRRIFVDLRFEKPKRKANPTLWLMSRMSRRSPNDDLWRFLRNAIALSSRDLSWNTMFEMRTDKLCMNTVAFPYTTSMIMLVRLLTLISIPSFLTQTSWNNKPNVKNGRRRYRAGMCLIRSTLKRKASL